MSWKRTFTGAIELYGKNFAISFYEPENETSLIINEDGCQRIHALRGDFRNEFEKAFPSLSKCMKIVRYNRSQDILNYPER